MRTVLLVGLKNPLRRHVNFPNLRVPAVAACTPEDYARRTSEHRPLEEGAYSSVVNVGQESVSIIVPLAGRTVPLCLILEPGAIYLPPKDALGVITEQQFSMLDGDGAWEIREMPPEVIS